MAKRILDVFVSLYIDLFRSIDQLLSLDADRTVMSRLMRKGILASYGLRSFKRVCPATQKGQMCSSLPEHSSSPLYCASEQRRLWRDCADAQAYLSLRWSHM